MPRFTAEELAQVSKLKLGPDYITELSVEHKEEGKGTIPRRTRGLVLTDTTLDGQRALLVLFPRAACDDPLPTWSQGHQRVVLATRLQTVANTDRRDWDFSRLKTRPLTR
jgi:hypothetical protein